MRTCSISKFYCTAGADTDKMSGKSLGVREFFRGKNVFISGATGFLGKVVLHKVLTTVPDVGDIRVLIRAKNGASPEERLKHILGSVIFDGLRRSDPARSVRTTRLFAYLNVQLQNQSIKK